MPDLGRRSCGALTATDVGATVQLDGWVNRRRDHGGLIFIDLRDRDGITQAVFDPSQAEAFAVAETLRNEDVVRLEGLVRRRPAGTENPKLSTGEIEVASAGHLPVLLVSRRLLSPGDGRPRWRLRPRRLCSQRPWRRRCGRPGQGSRGTPLASAADCRRIGSGIEIGARFTGTAGQH